MNLLASKVVPLSPMCLSRSLSVRFSLISHVETEIAKIHLSEGSHCSSLPSWASSLKSLVVEQVIAQTCSCLKTNKQCVEAFTVHGLLVASLCLEGFLDFD